ncbi:hypothetical protein NBRC13296_12720 [Paenibacillus chitinolyticus]|uniref:hypothetical protein n=1 Tax=Paenibacillus chitinolyticus TaxID=79263 RepID=UPI00355624BD
MVAASCNHEDLSCIKEAALNPILLDVLERDIKLMMGSEIKMKQIYARKLKHIQNLISAEFVDTKKDLKNRGLKIYEYKRDSKGVYAKFLCRGYHHEFSMLGVLIKSEVELRLAAYLAMDLEDDKTEL